MDFKKYLNLLISLGFAIVIGYIIIKISKKIFTRIIEKLKIDKTFKSFLISILNASLYLIYILWILDSIGLPMDGITAIIASIGVAVSLGVKDSLSNIASGFLLLISKPFIIGDYIEVDNVDGDVIEIGIILTKLKTPDNKIITIPNNLLSTNTIINYSALNIRRLDLEFKVHIDSDLQLVFNTIEECYKNNNYVLKNLKTNIFLKEQFATYLLISARAYVNTDDYWDLKFSFPLVIYEAFLNKGIIIPREMVDVNVFDKSNKRNYN